VCMVRQIVKDKSGKVGVGHGLKAFGFIVIALGGGYASLSRDFRIGSLIIAIRALIVAIGEFFP